MFVARNLTKKVLNVAHMKPNGFMWNTSIRSFSIKFAKSHEYANVVDGVATVGITAHAADALGDIVYVELPAVGDQVEAGEGFGSVESVKAASDVYSPVSGEVVEINSTLDSEPGVVNESPFENGWFIKVKLSEAGEKDFDQLLNQTDYDVFKETENV